MTDSLITTLRSFKIFNMAILDLSVTLIVSYLLGQKLSGQGILYTILSIPVSILIHKLFGVETELTRQFDELF